MRNEPNKRCVVCQYWMGTSFSVKTLADEPLNNPDVRVGHCHRNPPRQKNWPLVMGSDICGEFLLDKERIN